MIAIKVGNVRYSLAHISSVQERQSEDLYRSQNDTYWYESTYSQQDKSPQSGLVVCVYYDFAVEEGQAFDMIYMDDAAKFLELYDKYMNTLEQ